MATVVLEVEVTRDIGRQLLRHDFDFQEFSQRYANPLESMGMVVREFRFQDETNRQKSIDTDPDNWEHLDRAIEWEKDQKYVIEICKNLYDKWTKNGLAKEQARAILPEGLTMSRMYVSGSLRNWIHYCAVRRDASTTQKEHVDIANQAWNILSEHFSFLKEIDDPR